MSFDIKKAWATLIEQSGNPLMPIILQDAYKHLDLLGKAMAGRANRAKTVECYENLLAYWEDDEEFEEVSASPEFIIALAGMLCTSLKAYVVEAQKEDEK